jgi:hypothetical protein
MKILNSLFGIKEKPTNRVREVKGESTVYTVKVKFRDGREILSEMPEYVWNEIALLRFVVEKETNAKHFGDIESATPISEKKVEVTRIAFIDE